MKIIKRTELLIFGLAIYSTTTLANDDYYLGGSLTTQSDKEWGYNTGAEVFGGLALPYDALYLEFTQGYHDRNPFIDSPWYSDALVRYEQPLSSWGRAGLGLGVAYHNENVTSIASLDFLSDITPHYQIKLGFKKNIQSELDGNVRFTIGGVYRFGGSQVQTLKQSVFTTRANSVGMERAVPEPISVQKHSPPEAAVLSADISDPDCPTTHSYTTVPGDCLYCIASAHHISYEELMKLNNNFVAYKDPNVIQIGDIIFVPSQQDCQEKR